MTAKSRALALLAGVMFLVSAAPPEIDFAPVPMFTYVKAVRQLFCGRTRGTGFYTGAQALTSANHVTEGNNCGTDNEVIQTVYADAKLDFSSSRVTQAGEPLQVDCNGFKEGREYIGIGYAHGQEIQRVVVVSPNSLISPLYQWEDFTTLVGRERLIPGMSGGPVVDAETGKVVGIVRGYNGVPGISYARDVKDTPLCPSSVSVRP